LAQVEFCNCNQKGNYSLGIVTLDSGELACKNCRGVIPLADISEEVSQIQVSESKQSIGEDHLTQAVTNPQRSPALSKDLREKQNGGSKAAQESKELFAYLDSIDKSLFEILRQIKTTNFLLFIFFGLPALVGFFIWLFVFSGI